MVTEWNITAQGFDKSPVLTEQDQIEAFAMAQGIPEEGIKLMNREEYEWNIFFKSFRASDASGSEPKSSDELLRLWEAHRESILSNCPPKIFVVT